MPSSHLILCCPLFLLPPIPPSIKVFSNESALHMRWPKYWSFSFSISPSNEYSGLISFRTDWFDLLAVQGTLKSFLLPPIPPSIRVFSSESTLHMRWPKYWSFSFSIIPSKKNPGLISFRMDLLNLLVQAGFRKGRGTRDQIANIRWIMEKAREFQKNIYFCLIDYAKAFHCVDHNKLWTILKEMGIPDHLTCLLRNLYAG